MTTRQFSPPPGRAPASRPAPARAPAAAPPASGPISAETAEQNKLADQQFEAVAARLLAPTTDRPALTSKGEVDGIRRQYATGIGRRQALEALCHTRELYWREQSGGGPQDLTEFQRTEAHEFFDVFGVRLSGQPGQSRPPTTEAPAGGPNLPKPEKPVATPPASGISAEVEYEDPSGFPWRIRLTPTTTEAEIAALMKLAGTLREKMVAAGVKPPSPPGPVMAPAASAGPGAQSGPPQCKYHGAMKPSKKPGTWFCPKKLADGNYCDQKWEE